MSILENCDWLTQLINFLVQGIAERSSAIQKTYVYNSWTGGRKFIGSTHQPRDLYWMFAWLARLVQPVSPWVVWTDGRVCSIDIYVCHHNNSIQRAPLPTSGLPLSTAIPAHLTTASDPQQERGKIQDGKIVNPDSSTKELNRLWSQTWSNQILIKLNQSRSYKTHQNKTNKANLKPNQPFKKTSSWNSTG